MRTLVRPTERVFQIVVHALSMLGSPTHSAHHHMLLPSWRACSSYCLCLSLSANTLKQLLLGYDQRIRGHELLILIIWDVLEVSTEAHSFLFLDGCSWPGTVFLIRGFGGWLPLLLSCTWLQFPFFPFARSWRFLFLFPWSSWLLLTSWLWFRARIWLRFIRTPASTFFCQILSKFKFQGGFELFSRLSCNIWSGCTSRLWWRHLAQGSHTRSTTTISWHAGSWHAGNIAMIPCHLVWHNLWGNAGEGAAFGVHSLQRNVSGFGISSLVCSERGRVGPWDWCPCWIAVLLLWIKLQASQVNMQEVSTWHF